MHSCCSAQVDPESPASSGTRKSFRHAHTHEGVWIGGNEKAHIQNEMHGGDDAGNSTTAPPTLATDSLDGLVVRLSQSLESADTAAVSAAIDQVAIVLVSCGRCRIGGAVAGSAAAPRIATATGAAEETTMTIEVALVLADDDLALCRHKFGHQVAIAIVSSGTCDQQLCILRALRAELQRFTRHRFTSQVLEHALLQVDPAHARALAKALVGDISKGISGALPSLRLHPAD